MAQATPTNKTRQAIPHNGRVSLRADCKSLASFLESNASGEQVEVDEANGIIRNVLILGPKSPNTPYQNGRPMPGVTEGTQYTPSAFATAAKVMEGAKVRKNHPDRRNPNADRDVEDGLGVFRNCRPTPSGVRGDFHYNRQNPFNAQLVEDVKRRMGQWGFSPNAVGVGVVKNGVYVVEEIAHVRSVDLVSDPATTVNLWESRQMSVTCTVGSVLESALPRLKGKPRTILARFLENMGMPGDPMAYPKKADVAEEDPAASPSLADVPMDAPAEGGDPMEAISAGFTTALKALVDSMMSGDMTEEEATAKFKELAKTHAKLKTGGDSSAAPEPAVTAEGEDEGAKEEKEEEKVETKESKSAAAIAKELAALKAEKAVSTLCESLNYKPTPTQVRAAVALQESERIGFIKELVALQRKPVSSSPSLAPAPKAKNGEKPLPTDGKSFAAYITGGN